MKTSIKLIILLFTIHGQSQCFQKVAVGFQHTLVIKDDGALWGWGSNIGGALGLNTPTPEYFTPQKIGNENDWVKVYAGVGRNSFAIKSNGTLWAWGDNPGGQVGNGSQAIQYYPIQIGTDTNWDYISSGGCTIAKKTDGTLWGWGANIRGQLNIGIASIELVPIQISTETNWNKIVCGDNHTLAIKNDGTLWACGLNDYGQLGDGTNTDRFNFVQIGTDNNWADITAEFKHSVAIKTNGTIWGWGTNVNSVLGLPATTSQLNIPTQLGTATNWSKITTGYGATKAIKTNGTLWITYPTGFQQVQSDSDWNFVDSGEGHFFAMKTNGTLWGMGGNDYGQLGIGHEIQGTLVPTQLNCSALGMEVLENNSSIRIYPNPTTDKIFISNTTNIAINNVKVIDVTGKVILDKANNFSEINLQSVKNGIYFLSITSDNKTTNYKIVKI